MSSKEQDPGHMVTGVILWAVDGQERTAAAPSTFRTVLGAIETHFPGQE